MKISRLLGLFALLLGLTEPVFAGVPLDGPTSVAWDERTRSWFVSNTGPSGESAGWIARLDAADKRADPYWLKGLHLPRGIAVVGDRLYVAEPQAVAVVDIAARTVVARYRVAKARRLHGVTADDAGNVYVSDILANTIYRLKGGSILESFVASNRLGGPAGITVHGSNLVVASWGAIENPITLATRSAGRLLRVSLKTKAIAPVGGSPIGHLDGVALMEDRYLVTDRVAGTLFSVPSTGKATLIRGGLKGPAGIGFSPQRKIVAVPEHDANDVVFVSLKAQQDTPLRGMQSVDPTP
jgi:DNA-binding beta-propeller fold protein YncE